ncbi:MAG TPA: bifunctional hydroxymethylpyrimidine kinase/phosphomethylpyrimidine kinase [Solirubrobacteraceae bacterium]|jgi:hydroxymethylpyrimidine/phosphomethylpyrimidine kinase|nr:bifunctional hydroxymethylpyrimidine kinase/phosphomethylpyrimidine kinase [Solirubrobacteraceae bacterium]
MADFEPRVRDGVTRFLDLRWDDPETARIGIRPELTHSDGRVLSGVATYGLVDYAMGAALGALVAADEHVATINISINYVQTANAGELVCRTVVDRRNRTSAVLRSEAHHEDGPLLVTAIGTYAIYKPAERARATVGPTPRRRVAEDARTPRALSIAGSDSGGGAGIQADLKAFAACGVHGMTAITAITAQSTVGVSAVHPTPPELILEQVRVVLEDIGVDAVKVGMLGSAESARAVARALELVPAGTPVVVDTVMVAESGARLLDPDAERVLLEEILPRASVITPNLFEARALAAARPRPEREDADEQSRAPATPAQQAGTDTDEEVIALSRALLAYAPGCVVVTGGHREKAEDLFVDRDRVHAIPGVRARGGAAHGSGCTHSSLIAALMALGADALTAAIAARALAGEAVARGLRDIGAGTGPVDAVDLAERRGQARQTLSAASERLP